MGVRAAGELQGACFELYIQRRRWDEFMNLSIDVVDEFMNL